MAHWPRKYHALWRPNALDTRNLPVDERGASKPAGARADWWALAMTLAEKACGAAGLPLGTGVRVWTAAEVRAHLAAHLPAGVWAELAVRVGPEGAA